MAKIEYFYASYSGYAYLGSARFYEIAKTANRKIVHRPVNLREVVSVMAPSAFNKRSKAHIDYYFGREISRWSEFRNTPKMKGIPTHHNNSITLSNCTLIAGIEQGHNIDRLAHAMLQAHWRDDADSFFAFLDRPPKLPPRMKTLNHLSFRELHRDQNAVIEAVSRKPSHHVEIFL